MRFWPVSGRSPVAIIKAMNGLRNGGLISGQILVNPAVKSGVTQISGGYKSTLQTTKALPLSAGLITMSCRARSD
jgi:hypothetical protein